MKQISIPWNKKYFPCRPPSDIKLVLCDNVNETRGFGLWMKSAYQRELDDAAGISVEPARSGSGRYNMNKKARIATAMVLGAAMFFGSTVQTSPVVEAVSYSNSDERGTVSENHILNIMQNHVLKYMGKTDKPYKPAIEKGNIAHYESSLTSGGRVRVGENQFWKWSSGNDLLSASMHLAYTMSHELGHRYMGSPWGLSGDKTKFRGELKADSWAIDSLEAVPEFSVGSMMYYFGCEGDNEIGNRNIDAEVDESYEKGTDMSIWKMNDKVHPSKGLSGEMAYNRIVQSSNGRVRMHSDALFVDGKVMPIMESYKDHYGMLRNEDGSTEYYGSRFRTDYLAGNIATSIKKGVWKRSNIEAAPEPQALRELYPDVADPGGDPTKTILYVRESSSGGRPAGRIVKVLGRFNVNMNKPRYQRTENEQIEAGYINWIREMADGGNKAYVNALPVPKPVIPGVTGGYDIQREYGLDGFTRKELMQNLKNAEAVLGNRAF